MHSSDKTDRMLEIFFRGMRGEKITVRALADDYGVSTKSISRDISRINNFLADNRDLMGNSYFEYSYSDKSYHLKLERFLEDKELFAIVKILLGCRAFSKIDMFSIIDKLKMLTTTADRNKLETLISKEKQHYNEVHSDCQSVIDNVWKLSSCITEKKEITITYYKMNRDEVKHRIKPVSIIFTEYYFYLIAYKSEDENYSPVYFRIDRIRQMTEHREKFILDSRYDFDAGELREKIQFMFPGKCRKIKFEFSGPSCQAILDRMPTAKVVDIFDGKYIIEADVYGDGVKMYLLSQGSWVKVLSPPEFVEEMKDEIDRMRNLY